ncbi:MAG TPA: HIT domain-containing protein [Acidimicrobiales bacterium]|nr:HIT domain-containing protein [Acidimicrobiales bacterium]
MPLDHLWATWRSAYVRKVVDTRTLPSPEEADGKTLFERILAGADEEGDLAAGILHRGATCFAILNAFPYTAGHLMVLPNRAVADLEDLAQDEHDELWATVRDAVVALKAALQCDAVNVGLNLGPAAGGSQSDHLHVHCVPRWQGDANFIGVTAETRVLPLSLPEVGERLRAAWPS